MGECACGVIGDNIICVGEGDDRTFIYNIPAKKWSTVSARRPHPGHHHSPQVINGKLYLFGGISDGSERRVQIYDPSKRTWSKDSAQMPFDFGSGSTALFSGKVLACGGIAGKSTHASCATYDVGRKSWRNHGTTMRKGRNHAGYCKVGSDMLVLGGRDGGNVVGNAFQDYQAIRFSSSPSGRENAGPRLSSPRGGVGNCVWEDGPRRLWIFGGEYNSAQRRDWGSSTSTNSGGAVASILLRKGSGGWRTKGPMPQGKHGVYPVVKNGVVYIAGGGVKAANSQSRTMHYARLSDIERYC